MMRSWRIHAQHRILGTIENANAMNQLMKYLVLPFLLTAASPGEPAAQVCAPNWSASEYKSFGDLQNEVKQLYGEVRILRVALCDQGGKPYFQVVIISGHGEVRRVQVAAVN
jgi:hypothetical protein